MSAKKEPTTAILMQFVITPKHPTTARVNQDMKGTDIIAQVVSFLTWHFACPRKHCFFYCFY